MVASFAGNDFVASMLLYGCTFLIVGVTVANAWKDWKARKAQALSQKDLSDLQIKTEHKNPISERGLTDDVDKAVI